MSDETVPAVVDEEFSRVQRQAMMMSKSDLVPDIYKGGGDKAVANCIIAMQMAKQIGASSLMVMQNLHIIKGKPGWSSTFIISAINSCGRFTQLKYKKTGAGMTETCMAYATEKETGEVLEGPTISMQMAKDEGWLGKAGSKWKTMQELMLMYRAASFFGRLYAPDILLGMHTVEELPDMTASEPTSLADGVVEIKEVEGEVVIEDAVVEAETEEVPANATTEKIDPPEGKDADNPIVREDVIAIYAILNDLGIKDHKAQHDEVSDILGFNATLPSINYLNSMQAGIVIENLEAKREARK